MTDCLSRCPVAETAHLVIWQSSCQKLAQLFHVIYKSSHTAVQTLHHWTQTVPSYLDIGLLHQHQCEFTCIHFLTLCNLYVFMTHCQLALIYCNISYILSYSCLWIYCWFGLAILSNVFTVNQICYNNFVFFLPQNSVTSFQHLLPNLSILHCTLPIESASLLIFLSHRSGGLPHGLPNSLGLLA